MLIRVCDKCRAELSSAAPIVTVRAPKLSETLTMYDFCNTCLHEILTTPFGKGRAANEMVKK